LGKKAPIFALSSRFLPPRKEESAKAGPLQMKQAEVEVPTGKVEVKAEAKLRIKSPLVSLVLFALP
jgi:hypothetical protein